MTFGPALAGTWDRAMLGAAVGAMVSVLIATVLGDALQNAHESLDARKPGRR